MPRERLGMVGFPAVTSRGILVHALVEQGELTQALAYAEEQRQIAEGLDHPMSLAAANWGVGQAHLARRDVERAVPALERATEICQSLSVGFILQGAVADLGYAYALGGREADALPVLGQALEQLDVAGDSFTRTRAFVTLGEAYLVAGGRETASDLAGRALALARDQETPGHEAWALRLVGEIAAHADPPEVEQAESYYRQALVLAEELGMRPLVAHCHLGLGTLYQRVGRDEQAQAELATAADAYRTMEMPYWLEKAEAALASEPSRTMGDG
jgi:tetratricopeptide (TPR) repeat protein